MFPFAHSYTFDPHNRLGEIAIVGLGGTGSHLARSVTLILYDRIH
jgi:hypothetical protein